MNNEPEIPVIRNEYEEFRVQLSPPPLAIPYGVTFKRSYPTCRATVKKDGQPIIPDPKTTFLTASDCSLEWNGAEKGELFFVAVFLVFCIPFSAFIEYFIAEIPPISSSIIFVVSMASFYLWRQKRGYGSIIFNRVRNEIYIYRECARFKDSIRIIEWVGAQIFIRNISPFIRPVSCLSIGNDTDGGIYDEYFDMHVGSFVDMATRWEFYRRYMQHGLQGLPPLQDKGPLYDFSGSLLQKLKVIFTKMLPDMLYDLQGFLHRSQRPAPWPKEILALCEPGAEDAPLPSGYAYDVPIPVNTAK